MLIIYRNQIEYCNSELLNLTLKIVNDDIHDTSLDASFFLFKPLLNAFLYFEFRFPDSSTDTKYQRKLFGSTINWKRALEGAQGNFMISSVFKSVLDSLTFEAKFPLKTVRMFFCINFKIIIFYFRDCIKLKIIHFLELFFHFKQSNLLAFTKSTDSYQRKKVEFCSPHWILLEN